MEKSTLSQGILERLLDRTGGWYIVIVALFAQLIASVSTLLGVIFERLNADYTPETIALLSRINAVVISAVIITLLIIVFFLSRTMRVRLDIWKQEPELFKNDDNGEAWESAQNIIWKYALLCNARFV